MTSPYINTKLSTNLILHPMQMNNNIYNNLKRKLVDKLNKKCFGEYGYIIQIYELLTYKNGTMEAENTTASALYDVTFSCRLCKPLKNITIIAEVERINKILVRLQNGPIFVAITNTRINTNVFFKDNSRNLRYKQENKSYILSEGDIVKVTIVQTTFYSGDNHIFALGFLDAIATEDEIESYYKDMYDNDENNNELSTKEVKIESYKEYMKKNETNNIENDDIE